MFNNVLLLLLLAAGVILVAKAWRRVRVRELARLRLAERDRPMPLGGEPRQRAHRFVQRHAILPWIAAVVVGVILYVFVGLPVLFAVALGVMIGLLGGQLEAFRVARTTFRIEAQLADAIDLMVAALQAGAGASSALQNATSESRQPLRLQIEEVLGRLRLGDDPQTVFRELEGRVPLETFRLFASALSVHWETGGSLAPTLATVGRVIRDRIEVNRRIRSLTNQARLSTLSVLAVTYFVGLIIWRNDPERMRQFLATTIGQFLVAGALLLQAVGIVWSAALSRLKY